MSLGGNSRLQLRCTNHEWLRVLNVDVRLRPFRKCRFCANKDLQNRSVENGGCLHHQTVRSSWDHRKLRSGNAFHNLFRIAHGSQQVL